MRILLLSMLFVLVLPGCAPEPSLPSHARFNVGASRTEIQREFGDPQRTQILRKQGFAIGGAIESFWDRVPNGSDIEIWSFRSESSDMGTGRTELYFVDGAETVNGIGFSPDGVVYESGGGG